MHHGDAAPDTFGVATLVLVAALLAGLCVYLALVVAARRRGRSWPWWRTGCMIAGTAAGLAAVGPLAQAGHHDFVAHTWGHLLLGMVAPLLIVLSAPVTIALRGLGVRSARRLSALLRTPLVRVVAHPVVAAVLDVGGLWVLYTTPLFGWMHSSALGHLLIHAHVLFAGILFTASVLQVDPASHPYGVRARAVVVVGFLAAHGVLTKVMYEHPPVGVDAVGARAGAQLMYYGGDVVHVMLIIVFCWDVYRRTAPRAVRDEGRPTPVRPVVAAPDGPRT